MRKQDPVLTKLQELAREMVHLVQACREEKGLTEDEFVAIRQDLQLLEVLICTLTARIEGDVSGVGGQMLIQHAMIKEMWQRITIWQKQDNTIIKEAGDMFLGIDNKIHHSQKKPSKNG
jgi:hypothetical protein